MLPTPYWSQILSLSSPRQISGQFSITIFVNLDAMPSCYFICSVFLSVKKTSEFELLKSLSSRRILVSSTETCSASLLNRQNPTNEDWGWISEVCWENRRLSLMKLWENCKDSLACGELDKHKLAENALEKLKLDSKKETSCLLKI